MSITLYIFRGEQKMIVKMKILLLHFCLVHFWKEVKREEENKNGRWILWMDSSEANSRMAKQSGADLCSYTSVAWLERGIPHRRYRTSGQVERRETQTHLARYRKVAILAPVLILTTIYWFSDNSDGNDAIVWMEARGNDSEVCTVLLPDSSTVLFLNSQAKLKASHSLLLRKQGVFE